MARPNPLKPGPPVLDGGAASGVKMVEGEGGACPLDAKRSDANAGGSAIRYPEWQKVPGEEGIVGEPGKG